MTGQSKREQLVQFSGRLQGPFCLIKQRFISL